MKTLFLVLLCSLVFSAYSQVTLPPIGGNQKSRISQWIGPVEVTITYNGPDVHAPGGKDRKGHIWGELVPYGFTDLHFGPSKASPWRAGSNENTTIYFSHDVKIEGQELKAGTYGFFIAPEKEGPWMMIFSKNSTSWGSFSYDQNEDALRVSVNPVESNYTEWLTYGFDDRLDASTTAFLQWENKRVAFKIEVPTVDELYLATIRNELRNLQGLNWQSWLSAARFCVSANINLEEGLTWAETAVSKPGIGVENFNTLSTKALVLTALKREIQAEAVMQKAINHPTATVQGIHFYGRSLLTQGKKERALEVFKLNRQLHPEDTFTTFVGLARGYEAVGNKKSAVKNWEIALKNIPENQKQLQPQYEAELKKLKEDKKVSASSAG